MQTKANEIAQLQQLIDQSKRIVFFGGAGVSTESGIPDFRSADGLYSQHYAYPPETILSHDFFFEHTEEFYRFYRDKMLFLDAKPNAAHLFLAKLEQCGKLTAVVTQNIDGLHQMAGSRTVDQLHGTVYENYCIMCGKHYGIDCITQSKGVPRCSCGGIIKPDVVLYQEGLNDKVWRNASNTISNCDLLIVGGTSLSVYPAAYLVGVYNGKMVLVNKSATSYDSSADLIIKQSIAEVFGQLHV